MGVNFYIIPLENINPEYQAPSEEARFDLDEFAKALKAKWKNTEIRIDDSNSSHITWQCEINHKHKLRGSSSSNDYGIALEKPDQNDVEEFAIWYRTIIPADVRIVILDDSDVEHYCEITSNTTYVQLVDFFNDYDYWITLTLADNEPIDIDKLPSQLRAQWPQVEIFPMIEADPLSLYWEIKFEHEYTYPIKLSETESVIDQFTQDVIVNGAVSKNRTEMYLDPFPYSELAKTLIWYRGIVDENIELLVERREDHRQLKLRAETTEKEIIETFRRHWEMGM